MSIARISDETVPEFIYRAGRGGSVSTQDIASRFGWSARDAYTHLCVMEADRIVSRGGLVTLHGVQDQHWTIARVGPVIED